MYDAFSSDYDRFVDWPSRLKYEMPFLLQNLETARQADGEPLRVLDAAAGTAMHAIDLAQRGFLVAGADLSEGMIAQARINAQQAGVHVELAAVGFGQLAQTFANRSSFPFDAVLCLGNSLPHLLKKSDLASALADFAACLRPGGLVFLQNRNFDAVMAQRSRWMEPQPHRAGEDEWLFLRFYDFLPDGLIDFNVVTLRRAAGGPWQQQVHTTRLRPLLQTELMAALIEAGFNDVICYGDMQGKPFDPRKSGNLIIAARKS